MLLSWDPSTQSTSPFRNAFHRYAFPGRKEIICINVEVVTRMQDQTCGPPVVNSGIISWINSSPFSPNIIALEILTLRLKIVDLIK